MAENLGADCGEQFYPVSKHWKRELRLCVTATVAWVAFFVEEAIRGFVIWIR